MQTAFASDPALREVFEQGGSVSMGESRASFEQFLRNEKLRLGKLASDAKMTME
jgi:hypothetical protein